MELLALPELPEPLCELSVPVLSPPSEETEEPLPETLLPLLAPHLTPDGLVILLCNRLPAALPPGWEHVMDRDYNVRRPAKAASPAGETRRFLAVRPDCAAARAASAPLPSPDTSSREE